MFHRSPTLLFLSLAIGTTGRAAEPAIPTIELGAPFADNAILQREMPVPVWGWSKPGTWVTVEFAGQKKAATAGADGHWTVPLDPLTASAEPAEMVVTNDAGGRAVLKNVLVGEVWLASGQSNMQWPVSKTSVRLIAKALAEQATASGKPLPPIREGMVTNAFASLHPLEHAAFAWSDGASFDDYSAIAFAFAHELWRELGVPIGILNCSFSQTSIEAWTPRQGFFAATDDYNKDMQRRILETDPTTPEHAAAWAAFERRVNDDLAANAAVVSKGEPAPPVSLETPGNLRGNRDACWLFNARIAPVVPYAIRGAIWNQGYANIGGGLTYYDNLHALVAGWRTCWKRPDLPVYFNQFYSPGANDGLALGPMAEMRLGTWMARDIPHTGMASQIDITGSIHYVNKALSGQRLALHALKNQYGRKDLVADGPMFKGYRVEGDRIVVELEHADGLVAAKTPTGNVLEKPEPIAEGAAAVTLFYVADKNRVWHRAKARIEGSTLVVAASGVTEPHGVAYGWNGVGAQPGIFNGALLPLTPFISYDHAVVTSRTWPGGLLTVAGVEPDTTTVGRPHEYRRMPLLAQPFDDHAVLQADAPITIWGSAVHDQGYEAQGKAEITLSFAGTEKTIPVTPGMKEWRVTLPAMPASAEPKTLQVTFSIDGEKVHERICKDVVIGDVWYVAAAGRQDVVDEAGGPVRVMVRKSKRALAPRPSRYSVSTSTLSGEDNRFASRWLKAAKGPAAEFGGRLSAAAGRPIGIVWMASPDMELAHWIGFHQLADAPGLKRDYENIGAGVPGSPFYETAIRRHLAAWKDYWAKEVPALVASRRQVVAIGWGSYPAFGSEVTSTAAQAYNVMVAPFADFRFKGVVLLCGPKMVAADGGAAYAAQLPAAAQSFRATFGGNPPFYYTLPAKALAPQTTAPQGIAPPSAAVEVSDWDDAHAIDAVLDTLSP